jgi:hypothetical protein
MTQDEIIRFAIQCRLVTTGNRDGLYMDALTEFAKLVEDKGFKDGYEKGIAAFNEAVLIEREACAEIAEKQRYAMFISLTSHPAQNGTAVGIANAIRARTGNKND